MRQESIDYSPFTIHHSGTINAANKLPNRLTMTTKSKAARNEQDLFSCDPRLTRYSRLIVLLVAVLVAYFAS
jgi:hypothetical protein